MTWRLGRATEEKSLRLGHSPILATGVFPRAGEYRPAHPFADMARSSRRWCGRSGNPGPQDLSQERPNDCRCALKREAGHEQDPPPPQLARSVGPLSGFLWGFLRCAPAPRIGRQEATAFREQPCSPESGDRAREVNDEEYGCHALAVQIDPGGYAGIQARILDKIRTEQFKKFAKCLKILASAERFELPTRSLGRSRSIQLSYADICQKIIIAG